MKAQAWLIQEQYGVGMFVYRFREKHDKEGYEPLESFRPLIQLYFDSQIIFYNDLQVLAVRVYSELIRLVMLQIGVPYSANFFAEPDAC